MNGLLEFKKKTGIRYKTEICKNWEAGFCEFGEKCAFAHGRQEIREKSSYKTKKCKQFFENGYCMFGNKCIFQHVEDYSNGIKSFNNFDNTSSSRNHENNQSISNTKQRLPVFQQIYQN